MLLFERRHNGHHGFDKTSARRTLGPKAAFAPQHPRADGSVKLSERIAPPLVSRTVRATLAAHGSSIDRTLVMSTLSTGVFTSSPVYLVMTVTVNGR